MLDETDRRRAIQIAFNKKNSIVPKSIKKSINDIMESTSVAESFRDNQIKVKRDIKTDRFLNEDKKIVLEMLRQEMLEAADSLDFEKAATLRDEMKKLDKEIRISN